MVRTDIEIACAVQEFNPYNSGTIQRSIFSNGFRNGVYYADDTPRWNLSPDVPEVEGSYLVILDGVTKNEYAVAEYIHNSQGGDWYENRYSAKMYLNVIAWMPLPEFERKKYVVSLKGLGL